MDLNNLASNKLLMQYLAAAGADIGAGNPIGQNVNAVTQQSIAAQSKAATNKKMMQALSRMLGKGVDFKSDSEGAVTIKGDLENILSGGELGPKPDEGLELANTGSSEPGGSGVKWTTENMPQRFNPFSSELNANDMAGLSPQDISQSLSDAISVQNMKMNADQMKQKKITDTVDMIYKGALTDQAISSAEKNRAGEPLDKSLPIEVPGIGKVTQRQWNSLPTKDKEYALYRQSAINAGEDPADILSKPKFESLVPTERERFLRAAMDDPELMKSATELAKAGATTIGDVIGRAGATADVKAQKYFTDPEGLVSDIDKYMNSKEVRSKLIQYSDDPNKQEMETIRVKEKFIRGKITASGGDIVDEKIEGRTFVFTVKWPDGHTSEVRYAN